MAGSDTNRAEAMDCSEFLRRYSEYDDSLIGGDELDRFRAHLEACPSCARYDRVLRKGRMLARQLPTPEPADDFTPRLQSRLREIRRGTPRPLGAPGLAAALAAVTLLLGTLSAIGLMALPGPVSPMDRVREALARSGAVAPAAGTRVATASAPVRTLPALPSGTPATRRPWGAERVDPGDASSYSPLVIGPPAYRSTATIPLTGTTSRRRTLD